MRLHWATVLAAVCLAVAIGAVAYGAGKASAPEVIRAQRFEVIDGKGVIRAQLGVTELAGGGVTLGLCDETGKARAGLSVSDMGPVNLTLTDKHQAPRISLTVHAGVTSVQLLSGKTVALSEALPGGKGSDQEVWDAAEKAFAEAKTRAIMLMDDETGMVNIALFDEKGQPIWQAE